MRELDYMQDRVHRDAAIFTAYLLLGGAPHVTTATADRCGGQIGFAAECVEVAREISWALEHWHQRNPDACYPGVLAYELIEPLGEWLAAQDEYVQPRDAAARFLRQFREWIRS